MRADDARARERWSAAHGGLDPGSSRWVSGWLSLVHRCTRPLAGRGVPPGRVTVAGLAVAATVPALAWAGHGWPLAAAVCVVLSGVLDGIDGALARWDGSGTRWGGVLDDLVDRCSDLLMLAALAVLGAPAAWCVAAAVLTLLLEGVRASARVAGMDGIGTLTLWERPSRLVVTAFGTAACGVAGLVAPLRDAVAEIAGTAAAVAVLLAVVGVVQLVVAVRRALLGEVRPAPPSR